MTLRQYYAATCPITYADALTEFMARQSDKTKLPSHMDTMTLLVNMQLAYADIMISKHKEPSAFHTKPSAIVQPKKPGLMDS